MKKKSLILLTKQFPYMHREQYVAHELPYLAREFDKIYIYPHDHFGKNDLPAFELPSNVEVWNLNQDIQKIPRKPLLVSFVWAYFFELFRVHDKIWFLRNSKRFYSIYATQYALGCGLEKKIKSEKLDASQLVYYSYWFSASALCLAIMKSRGAIDSFVSRAHALDLYHEDWGLLNERVKVLPFRNFKQKYVDVIYSISLHGKNYLNKKYPGIQKVEVAYLGVDDLGLNPPKNSTEEVFHIVTCSGVDENKRLHILGEALSKLRDKKFRWTHFGSGPLEAELRQSVMGEHVLLDLRGQTPNADFRKFLSQVHADLFVNLSRVEGLPVSLMEAASHGIPLLATAANGSVEVAVQDENARVLPIDLTALQVSNTIESFMSDPLLEKMRASSRNIYLSKFNAAHNYSLFARELAGDKN